MAIITEHKHKLLNELSCSFMRKYFHMKIIILYFTDLVRYQCFVQKVPENVISSMKRFSEDETLQETCLEALAVLAAAGNHSISF